MNNIKIDIRSDGVYVIVDNSNPAQRVTRKALLDVIEGANLKNVDFDIINEILKSDEKLIEKKVSAVQADMPAVHENATIEVARDKLSAAVKFTPPQSGGNFLPAANS